MRTNHFFHTLAPKGLSTLQRASLAAIVLVTAAGPLLAQPLADHIPADALVYIGWRGTNNLQDEYNDSHLKKVVDTSDLEQAFTQLLPQIIAKAGEHNPHAAAVAKAVQPLLDSLLAHETAVYVNTPFKEAHPRPQDFRPVVVTDAGKDAATLVEQWHDLLQAAAPKPPGGRGDAGPMHRRHHPMPPTQVVATKDGLVIFSFGPLPPAQQVLLGINNDGSSPPAKSLADDEAFMADMKQAVDHPAVLVRVNTDKLFWLLFQYQGAMPAHGASGDPMGDLPPNPKVTFGALGLTDIHSITLSAGFDDKDWQADAFIDAPAPRHGLLAAWVDQKPLDDAAFDHVPRSAMMAEGFRFNLAGILTSIDQALATTDPRAHTRFQHALDTISQMAGGSLTQDILPELGDEWTAYLDQAVGGSGFAGTVFLGHPKDPAKASSALTNLSTAAVHWLAGMMHKPDLNLAPRTFTAEGETIHYLPTPMLSPAWIVGKDTLYVGLYPQTALAAAKYHGPTIAGHGDFHELRKQLDAKHATGFEYLDLPQMLPQAYSNSLMIQSYANVANIFGLSAPPMILPPLHQLKPEVTPAAEGISTDEHGVHFRLRSPFPGSLLIVAMQGMNVQQVASASMLAGILLPALSSARGAAKQMTSNTRLRGIVQDANIYALSANGHYPPDLATMYHNQLFAAGYVLSPNSGINVPPNFDHWPRKRQDAWFARNASYVLIPGLTNDLNSQEVAAFEKPQYAFNGGIGVVFNDDHVLTMPIARAKRLIKKQTGETMEQLIAESENPASQPAPPAQSPTQSPTPPATPAPF